MTRWTLCHRKEAVVVCSDYQDPRACGYNLFSFHLHPTAEMREGNCRGTSPSSLLTHQLPHLVTGPALLPPCVIPLHPSLHPTTNLICPEYLVYVKKIFICVWASVCLCVCMSCVSTWHVCGWVLVEAGRRLRASRAGVTGSLRHQTQSSRRATSTLIKNLPLACV